LRLPGLFAASVLLLLCSSLPFVAEDKPKPKQPPEQEQQQKPVAQAQQPEPSIVHLDSGDIRLGSGTVLHLEHFDGASIPHLDKEGCKHSTIEIRSGKLSLTDAGLMQLINHDFEKKGDKKRIKVTADGDKLKFEGSKAAGMNMTFEARPTALGGSRIALVATDVKMMHLPVKGLMHTFGLNMDDLMHPNNRALSVEKDNVIVDLRYVSKSTPLEGHVTSVVIQGHRIVLTFGKPNGAHGGAPATQTAKLKPNKGK
jgi:hypothetical protein